MTPERPTSSPTDPVHTALRARAERGHPRGADALLAATRADAESPAPGRLDDGADPRRRWATIAAAAVLVAGLAVGGTALARSGDDDTDAVASGGGWCRALGERAVPPEGIDPDLFVLIEPSATSPGRSRSAAVSNVAERLADDPRVDATHYVDETATYGVLRRNFADEPVILDNVRPEELPTSFEVRLVDPAEVSAAMEDYADVPGVYGTTSASLQHARVLDLLVVTGRVPAFRPGGPVGADWAPFADPWPGRRRAATEGAPALVVDAVDRLGAEFDARQEPSDEPPAADPSLARAADQLAAAAASSCGLEAAPWSDGPAAWAADGDAATQVVLGGDGDGVIDGQGQQLPSDPDVETTEPVDPDAPTTTEAWEPGDSPTTTEP